MSSPGERSNAAPQISPDNKGDSATQPAPKFDTPIASGLSREYERLDRKIRSMLSTGNIEKESVKKVVGRNISKLTRSTPTKIRNLSLVSSQIAREKGIARMLLEQELFAFASKNATVKATALERAFISKEVSEAITEERGSFKNWTPDIFKKSVFGDDRKRVENLFAAIANFDKAQKLLDAAEISQAQTHVAMAKLYLSISIPPEKEKETLDNYRKHIAMLGGIARHKNTNDFRKAIKKEILKRKMLGLKPKEIIRGLGKELERIYRDVCERNWLQRNHVRAGACKENGSPDPAIKECLSEMKEPEMVDDDRIVRWIQEINREFKKSTT